MTKMPCEKTDSGAINGPEDDTIIPEVEFIRVVPMQVGGIEERTTMALNNFYQDKGDIDIIVWLLEEWLNREQSNGS